METKLVKVDTENHKKAYLRKPPRSSKTGVWVAFLQRRSMDLGQTDWTKRLVKGYKEAKGRPSDNPLILYDRRFGRPL